MSSLRFIVPIVILIVAAFLGYKNLREPTFHEKNMNSEQHEILEADINEANNMVLSPKGKLNHIGWCRHPDKFVMNPEFIRASTSLTPYLDSLRYKKWEFYLFTSDEFNFGFAVFNMKFIKGHFIHFSDISDPNSPLKKHEYMNVFDTVNIADTCRSNCVSAEYNYNGKGIQKFHVHKNSPQSHKVFLKVDASDITINTDVTLEMPTSNSEHYTSFTPISEDASLFLHSTKSNTLIPVKGEIEINGKKKNLSDFSVSYDSGRGVWPVRSGWVWVSANGTSKDKQNKIGLNLGHGFSHPQSSRNTEDLFIVDGKIFKLPATKTVLSPKLFEEFSDINSYSITFQNENPKQGENHCNITFKTLKKIFMKESVLVLAEVNFIISYGKYIGTCTTAEGKSYEFELNGILEYQKAIW